jgi:integrase
MHADRETPMSCGNKPGSNKSGKPNKEPGERYTVEAYCHAIAKACKIAFGMPAEYHEPRGKRAREAEAALNPDVQTKRREDRMTKRAEWRRLHVWHPHQLRHNAATRLRKDFGLEAAQVILGHKTLAVTEVYAEKNVEAAKKIMGEVG